MREHGLEVRQRLPVRAGLRRLAGRGGPDGHDRLDVAGLDGVVHEPGALRPLLRAQRGDHGRVEPPAPDRGQALLDRAPRQLVAEGDAVGAVLEHAAACSASASASKRAPSSAAASSRSTVPGTTESWSSASRHVGARAGRHAPARPPSTLTGTASPDAASASVTKKGLPRVTRWRASASAPLPAASSRTAAARQRPQRDAVHRAAGEHAEEAVQRVAGVDVVVAAGEHEQRADRARSAAPRRRGRRASRRRPSGRPRRRARSAARRPSSSSSRAEHGVDRLLVGERGGERAVAADRGVPQRAERARRHQVVAGGEQDARPRGGVGRRRCAPGSSCRSRTRRSRARPSRARPRRRATARSSDFERSVAARAGGRACRQWSQAAPSRSRGVVSLRRARPGPRRW